MILASGKRKSALANARIHKKGTGKILVNGKPVEFYGAEMYVLRIKEPVILAGKVAESLDFHITVRGGGLAGQADAIRLSIAKALVEHKKELEDVFSNYDRTLLVADVRRREPRKPNTSGSARSKRQKSYR